MIYNHEQKHKKPRKTAMSGTLQIAVSGLNDASARIANAAANIVNASSTSSLPRNSGESYSGFVPQDVITLSQSDGTNNLGVQSQRVARDPAYSPVYDPANAQANDQGLVAAPNVDLANEAINLLQASVSYQANAAVISIALKTDKALLDIKT
jgi:flagellar basal-body rod protein FlgC